MIVAIYLSHKLVVSQCWIVRTWTPKYMELIGFIWLHNYRFENVATVFLNVEEKVSAGNAIALLH